MFDDYGYLAESAIDFQAKATLFTRVADALREAAKEKNPNDFVPWLEKIEEAVLQLTGIRLRCQISYEMSDNAYAIINPLSYQHPFHNAGLKAWAEETADKVKKYPTAYLSEIDLTRCRVSGVFSELEHTIVLAHNFLMSKLLTAEEAAAIFLHELGHPFMYYVMTAQSVITASVLQDVANEFSQSSDKQKRIIVLTKSKDIHKLTKEEMEFIAENSSAKTVTALVAAKMTKSLQNNLGLDFYHARVCEAMSDQFAVRHGAGRHLIGALDKMHRNVPVLYRDSAYLGFSGYLSIAAIYFGALALHSSLTGSTFTVASGGSTVVAAMVVMTIYDTLAKFTLGNELDRYDDPENRYLAMRREMVSNLKNQSISDQDRATILKDIETADKYIAALSRFKMPPAIISEFLHNALTGRGTEMARMRQLESLANNDLFVAAARIQSQANKG